jgi:hypothetical protein
MEACWNLATVFSSRSNWPALQASATCGRLAPTAKGGFVPDHQAVQVALGAGHGLEHAVQHLVADGVHLGLEGQDADAGVPGR